MSESTVLILGSGPVGMATAGLLGKEKACDKVITLDRSWGRAAAAAERCGDKAVSVGADCTEEEVLVRLLGDSNLVVNTLHLPSDTLIPLIRAVVEAGVPYTDATTSSESLQSVFDSEYLQALARHRSVGVIPGLGASPGLSNAIATYLGQRLERVDGVRFFAEDDLRRRRPGQWRDRLMAFGSPALVWREHGWKYVSPMSEWEDVSFPKSDADVSCCTVNLEPVTLPASFPSLAEVSCHRGFSHPAMRDIVRDLVDYGPASDGTPETPVRPTSPLESPWALYGSHSANWTRANYGLLNERDHCAIPLQRQIRVNGILQDRKTEFIMSYYFPGEQEEESIAATLSIGARMLLTRELPSPGLHPPEALDPAPFLWDMERRGVEIRLTKTVEE